jgi:hypothetical protein
MISLYLVKRYAMERQDGRDENRGRDVIPSAKKVKTSPKKKIDNERMSRRTMIALPMSMGKTRPL